MNNKTTEEITSIVEGIGEDKTKEIQEVIVEDPSNDLRLNVLKFFNSRIHSINSQEKLKLLVQQKLEKKLEEEDLTVNQLKDLFVVLSRESVNASQDILKVAHPAPGQSALAEDFSRKNHEEESQSSFTADEQRKLDALFRLMQGATSKFES